MEAAEGRWRVVWRELTNGEVVHAVERSEETMATLFTHQRQTRAWQWELPGVVLRQSGDVDLPQPPMVLASGTLASLEQGHGVAKLSWHSIHSNRLNTRDLFPDGELRFLVSGSVFGTVIETLHVQRVEVHPDWWGTALAIADLPPKVNAIFRSGGGLITVGHSAGRVIVLDPEQRRTVADIALKE